MKNKTLRIIALTLAVLAGMMVLLSGCASQDKTNGLVGAADREFVSVTAPNGLVEQEYWDENLGEVSEDASEEGTSQADAASGRKLIKNIDASIETETFDDCVKLLEDTAAALGGYTEAYQVQQYSYYADMAYRYGSLTLRIPADKLEEYKAALGEKGKVTDINEAVSDVTMKYTDLEAHIKALQTERDTLLGILENADNLADVLTVQERLTDVNYRLDSLESQLRLLADQVELSTVTLNITEVNVGTLVEPMGFWATVWRDIKANVSGISRWIRDFAGWFLGSLPGIILLAAAVTLVALLIRRAVRKRRNKQ